MLCHNGIFFSSSDSNLPGQIDFPLKLDLTGYVTHSGSAPGSIYELYAVLVHAGASTRSGHYYSFVRSTKPGSQDVWYSMDDARVRRVDVKTVLAQRAYILFYERQPSRSGQRDRATASEQAASAASRVNNREVSSLATKNAAYATQVAGNGVAERQASHMNRDAFVSRLGLAESSPKARAQPETVPTALRSCPRAFDNPYALKGILSLSLRTRSYYLAGLRRLRNTGKRRTEKRETSMPSAR